MQADGTALGESSILNKMHPVQVHLHQVQEQVKPVYAQRSRQWLIWGTVAERVCGGGRYSVSDVGVA